MSSPHWWSYGKLKDEVVEVYFEQVNNLLDLFSHFVTCVIETSLNEFNVFCGYCTLKFELSHL